MSSSLDAELLRDHARTRTDDLELRTTGAGSSTAPTDADARVLRGRYQRSVALADLSVASVAAALGIYLRFDGTAPGHWSMVPGLLPVAWFAILALHRTYEHRFLGSGPEEFDRVVRAGIVLFTVIAVSSYLSASSVSRSIVVFTVPVTVLGSALVRVLLRFALHRARRSGRGLERTIVVGGGDAAVHLVEQLRSAPHRGMEPVGVCLPPLSVIPDRLGDVPVLGGPADVLRAVDETGAHVVAVVSHPEMFGHPLRQLSWELDERDVELIVSPGIVEVAGPRLSIRPMIGLSLLHLDRPAASVGQLFFKSVIDRLLGTLMLIALAPLLLGLAGWVRLASTGPALLRQVQVGVEGRLFSMYKFRSGAADADPRVVRVGAWLRRYSLDELPQLINVMRGEMSLVGPRPPQPVEVEAYSDDALRRLRMRPGMTGLWQVSGRSDLSYEQALQLDLRYVDNWSMLLDLSILWRTIRAVVSGSGAC
jgi:exopolysaccharide biosynthesis polyprenyl glycosylphosphotransferase